MSFHVIAWRDGGMRGWEVNLARIEQKLDRLIAALPLFERRHEMQMEKLDAMEVKLTNLTTIGDGMALLLGTLHEEIEELKTGEPEQDAKVDALNSTIDSRVATWSEALSANTPGADDPAAGEPVSVSDAEPLTETTAGE
jgi:hypothetical protein